MKKQTIKVFGKTYYLLGKDQEGTKYWLEKEGWDCGWYWGFGYVISFTNNRCPENSKDINSLHHFDGMFFNQNKCYRDAFKDFFVETPLTGNEIWELVDYMKTFYTLKEVAGLFKHGYSWQTERAKIDSLENSDQQDLVNKVWLPEVFKRIEKLFTTEN